jgi:hypothetical protein
MMAGERESPMEIPQDYLNGVAFVCLTDAETGYRLPVATAFLVGERDTAPGFENYSFSSFVTARHVIENAPTDDIFLRVNHKDGAPIDILTKKVDWYLHLTTDIALVPLKGSWSIWQDTMMIPFPSEAFIIDQKFPPELARRGDGKPFEVMLGSEIFYMSLFAALRHEPGMVPIARFGRISRLLQKIWLKRYDDPDDKTYFETDAYLAEALSWGGHSGSPAVLVIQLPNGVQYTGLLGLVSAHFSIAAQARTSGDIIGQVEMDLNSGVAVIIPANYIKELLMSEELEELREQSRQATREQLRRVPTMDMHSPPAPFTRADMEAALRKVSRRLDPSPPGEASSETSE